MKKEEVRKCIENSHLNEVQKRVYLEDFEKNNTLEE